MVSRLCCCDYAARGIDADGCGNEHKHEQEQEQALLRHLVQRTARSRISDSSTGNGHCCKSKDRIISAILDLIHDAIYVGLPSGTGYHAMTYIL